MEHTLSDEEIKGLSWTALGLSLAFTILLFAPEAEQGMMDFMLSLDVIPAFLTTMGLVLVSFIPHEMAHRVTARSMDAYAEYEMWAPGLFISVLTAFLGFVFAATGGTRMYVRTRERYGLSVPDLTLKMIGFVAMVGPLLNVSLAVVFAFFSQAVQVPAVQGVNPLIAGATINSYMALFSLLPVYPIDGYRILRWNPKMWALTGIMAILTFFLV